MRMYTTRRCWTKSVVGIMLLLQVLSTYDNSILLLLGVTSFSLSSYPRHSSTRRRKNDGVFNRRSSGLMQQIPFQHHHIQDLSLLFSASEDDLDETTTEENMNDNIRYLGKGEHAIVRPGVVLLAPPNEYHHYYRQAAIFIYGMGEDSETTAENEDENNLYVIRGVIIDHPTPFTITEMTEQLIPEGNPLGNNLLYRGGDKGGDTALMLHSLSHIGNGNMIGTSGIYEGGLQDALQACQENNAKPENFKFYFNFVQFTEQELEQMLLDDPWISVEVPSEFILSEEWDRGDCWKRCRNAIRGVEKDEE